MGGAEQVEGSSGPAGRLAEAESGQEVAGGSTGMPPVVIADGRESQRAGRVYRSFTFNLAVERDRRPAIDDPLTELLDHRPDIILVQVEFLRSLATINCPFHCLGRIV